VIRVWNDSCDRYATKCPSGFWALYLRGVGSRGMAGDETAAKGVGMDLDNRYSVDDVN
jgi:hypothetical protein